MTKTKPVLNVSLDDIIKQEKVSQNKVSTPKKKKKGTMVGPPQDIDYDKFTDDEIKAQLTSRGLSTRGLRPKLVNRLKAEVQRAWGEYRRANKKGKLANLFPTEQKKAKKKKLSDEERSAIHAKNEANRLAKAKRRIENAKKQEESRRAKRQKREENQEKQATLKVQQKAAKEARQRCEVYVQFDIEKYKEDLKKKLDPKGTLISSVQRDFSKKGFVVKFSNASAAAKCAKGSTIKKQKTISSKLTAKILPSPVESKCVFFMYPLEKTHPSVAKAEEWTLTQNADPQLNELKKLAIWIQSALGEFSQYGDIVNIFRERGFLVINFCEEESAEKCLTDLQKEGAEFNGSSYFFVKSGTPTKADRLECMSKLKK